MSRKHITTSVPVAGKILFNMKPWSAYEAAKRGDIRVIPVGRLKRVPVVWMEQTAEVSPGGLDHLIDSLEAA